MSDELIRNCLTFIWMFQVLGFYIGAFGIVWDIAKEDTNTRIIEKSTD